MNKKRTGIISVLISGILLVMTGCGSRQQVEASDSIELLEPVSAAANTEAAAYRNIYEYKVLERFIHISESILLHRMWY